jgi:hypothetical protein
MIEAAYDVAGDVITVFAPSSTPWSRIEAAISLISPIDVGDIKAAKNLLQQANKAYRGRKGGIDTRAQNNAIGEAIGQRGGEVTGGFGGKEQYFKAKGNGTNRYSDGSAKDADGKPFQVQTVDTDASGTMTGREADAAMDIARRSQQPVICIPKCK